MLAQRREALELEDVDALERTCRMNGLPREHPNGADMGKEELIRVILNCEEHKIGKYVKKEAKKLKQ